MKSSLLSASVLTSVFMAGATPLLAQSSEDEASGVTLDTIVVNAQRRNQNILDVPVAVSTLDADALVKQDVDDVLDLSLASPSVFANTLSEPLSNSPIRIRGIGTGGGNPGFEGAVGMYVDEIYRSRGAAALLSFFDMAGVDILRGPQGTLFGKNTTAGAIVQRTAAPDIGEYGAYLEGEAGNFSTYEVEGMVNVPLGEAAALRVSGIWNETDGFITDPVSGDPRSEVGNRGIRVQFAAEPTDRLSVRVIGDWGVWETTGQYSRSTRITNQDFTEEENLNNTVWPFFALNTAIGGAGYWYWTPDPTGANPGPVSPFDYQVAVQQQSQQEMYQQGVAGYIDFDISDSVTLRSITSYRSIDSDNENGDWDFGPTALGGFLNNYQNFETFSQEVLAQGETTIGGVDVDFTAGFHYFSEEFDFTRQATLGPQFALLFAADVPDIPPSTLARQGFPFQNHNYLQNETSYGLFGHVDIAVTEQLSLIGGLRWNQIDKDVDYTPLNGATSSAEFDAIAANALSLLFVNSGVQTAFAYENETSDEELTYNITLQYQPTDESQLYASYSRGFKAGGFNLTENAAGGLPLMPPPVGPASLFVDGRSFTAFDPDFGVFSPEFVDAYEIGFRLQYLDRGRLSLVGFWSDYSDLQVSVFNGLSFEVINAGTSRSRGIEFENTYAVTEDLTVNAGFTWLDATYGDDAVGLPAGRARGLSPDLSLVLGAFYEREIGNDMSVYANANFSYYTDMYLAEGQCEDAMGNFVTFSQCDASLGANQLAVTQQDAYGVFTASVGMRLWDGVDVSLFCQNCFSAEFFTYAFNQPFVSGGSPLGDLGAPRSWGGRIRKDF